jgi:flagellar protein FlaG
MEPMGKVRSQETNGLETVFRSSKPDIHHTRVTAPRTETSRPDQAETESIARSIDNRLKSEQIDLKIRVDKQTGRIVVKVVLKEDEKIIRQIPSEDMLKLAASLDEMTGIIFDTQT